MPLNIFMKVTLNPGKWSFQWSGRSWSEHRHFKKGYQQSRLMYLFTCKYLWESYQSISFAPGNVLSSRIDCVYCLDRQRKTIAGKSSALSVRNQKWHHCPGMYRLWYLTEWSAQISTLVESFHFEFCMGHIKMFKHINQCYWPIRRTCLNVCWCV